MKRVKLKSKSELKRLGFRVVPVEDPDGLLNGDMISLVDKDNRGITLDLKRCDDMVVAPSNSITQEAFEVFCGAFEELES